MKFTRLITACLISFFLFGTLISVLPARAQQGDTPANAQQQFEKCMALMQSGALTEALVQLEAAQQLYAAAADTDGEGKSWLHIGLVYMQTAQYERAREALMQSLALLDTSAKSERGLALLNLGRIWSQHGEYEQALQYFEQARSIWIALGDAATEATTLYEIGKAYSALHRPDSATAAWQAALNIIGDAQNEQFVGQMLTDWGDLQATQGEKERALDSYKRALDIWRTLTSKEQEQETLAKIGQLHLATQEYPAALATYEELQTLASQRHDPTLAIQAQTQISLTQNYISIATLQNDLAQARRLNQVDEQAQVLESLGALQLAIADDASAISDYEQALALWRAVENRAKEGFILGRMAKLYVKWQKPQEAIDLFNQQLFVWKITEEREREAATLGDIGLAQLQNEDSDGALTSLQRSLALWQILQDLAGVAGAQTNLGIYFSAEGDFANAALYFAQAVETWNGLQQPAEAAAVYQQLADSQIE